MSQLYECPECGTVENVYFVEPTQGDSKEPWCNNCGLRVTRQ